MKPIPIFFLPELVKANFDGQKIVTRRNNGLEGINQSPDEWIFHSYDINRKGKFCALFSNRSHPALKQVAVSPFGMTDDTLWVRETWMNLNIDFPDRDPIYVYKADLLYGNDYGPINWKPNIHMPKDACRQFLKVESVRVERVQDITEEEAKLEGVTPGKFREGPNVMRGEFQLEIDLNHGSYKDGFQYVIWQLYGRDFWNENRWVWRYRYDLTEKPANWPK